MPTRIKNPLLTVPGAMHADAERAALVLNIAVINFWNRINVASRQIAGAYSG